MSGIQAGNTTTTSTSADYVPGSKADGSAGATAGQTVGDKLKGGWNVFHGAGEGIRGNFNSLVDNLGEQVAGRDPANQPESRSANGERPAGVAATGADEIQKGVSELKK